MKKRLFLIDGMGLMFRAHHANKGQQLRTSEGKATTAIHHFINLLWKLLEEENPEYIAIVFDVAGPTFRHELFEDYKGTRDDTPDEIIEQLPTLKTLLQAMGLPLLEQQGVEADDIIGTLATIGKKEGFEIFIVSEDKDFAQLVDDDIHLLSLKKKKTIGVDEIVEKYKVRPDQFIDYLALVGDNVDNIPGVKQIGPKKASTLLQKYGSLDNIYASIDDISKAYRKHLIPGKDAAYLSQKLVTIRKDVEQLPAIEKLTPRPKDEETLRRIFKELEFSTLFQKITGQKLNETLNIEVNNIQTKTDLIALREKIQQKKIIVLHPLIEYIGRYQEFYALAFGFQTNDIYYLSLYDKEKNKRKNIEKTKEQLSFFEENHGQSSLFDFEESTSDNPHSQKEITGKNDAIETLTQEDFWETFQEIFESTSIKKIGHDLKELHIALGKRGIELRGIVHDTQIASHLINPERSKHDLAHLSKQFLQIEKQKSKEQVLGTGRKKKSWPEADPIEVAHFLAEEALLIVRLHEHLDKELKQLQLFKLMQELELPLISVLSEMEREGIALDVKLLEEMARHFHEEIDKLLSEIAKWADDPNFNVNSSKQVAALLYDKLAIHEELGIKVKKTPKGAMSTNSSVLEALSAHPLPRLILDYRELQKLLSTYIEALPELVIPDENGQPRIHTRLDQTGTATGRLASSSPNLQNIPIRTEQGRAIRKAFIPSQSNWLIASADYSQVELRILAHVSQDEELIRAFREGVDIHARTASLVLDIPVEQLTPEQRNTAKAVNFGVIYGMGAPKLAKQIGVPIYQAAQFIKAYFESYPQVKKYIDSQIEFARENHYIETLLGRRRYIYDITSSNPKIRASAEHIAVNAPIQGSAADLIKKAMLNVSQRLKMEGFRSKMLLQIHDELLFEVPPDEQEKLKEMLTFEMSHAMNLSVPLVISVNFGKNWAEAH